MKIRYIHKGLSSSIPQRSLWECLHCDLPDYVLNQIVLCACIHMPSEDVIFRAASRVLVEDSQERTLKKGLQT